MSTGANVVLCHTKKNRNTFHIKLLINTNWTVLINNVFLIYQYAFQNVFSCGLMLFELLNFITKSRPKHRVLTQFI